MKLTNLLNFTGLKSFGTTTLIITATALLSSGVFSGDDHPVSPAGQDTVIPATADWYKDPDCRLVFFATLEGLYENGISNEVVDLVLGRQGEGKDPVKTNFIFRCELCHAVYDAFSLYRTRPAFHGTKIDSFKKGVVEEQILLDLQSEIARTRVYAMGSLIQPWIKSKLLSLSLDDEAKKSLRDRLIVLAQKGSELTFDRRKNDPDYGDDWGFYGACQACEAVNTVSRLLPEGE